jgi:uncharacterized coiled-coil DUF342 family protein
MKNKALICLTLVVCSLSGYSQIISSRSSKNNIVQYYEGIKLRIQIIPSSEVQLFEELKWANGELSKITTMKDDDNNFKTSREKVADMGKRSKNYFDVMKTISCDAGGGAKIQSQLYSMFSLLENFALDYDMENSSEWSDIQGTLTPYFYRSGSQLTMEQCKELSGLISGSLKNQVDEILKKVEEQINQKEKESVEVKTIFSSIEKDLNDYRKKLMEAQSKFSTKQNLESNLYLMILIIGGLSVLAIGMVRLFPETVMLEWVVSGQVIQFVTIMILLSAIMALGLSGLITENTLGTLLGGVAGYVLSQGIGAARSKAAPSSTPNPNPNPGPNPNPNPAPNPNPNPISH